MSEILCNRQGAVAHIRLNRPELSNAFNDRLIADLTSLLEEIDRDPSIRVVVLGGEGKHFCAGADLNWMRSMVDYSEEENREDAARLANMLKTLNGLSKPVIARCQGAAFGGGVGLLACCDMVVATEKSLFCLSEVRLGLTPATISPYVIQAIGARHARRYFLTAERFDGERGRELGLVTELVSSDALDDRIAELTEHLLQGGPEAISDAKTLVAAAEGELSASELNEFTVSMIARQRVRKEGQEGLSAFLNKRKPEWQS